MFLGAPSFCQDISSWDVSSVIDKKSMFEAAGSIQQRQFLPNEWQNNEDLEEVFFE
jgi:surface protein